MKQRTDWFAGSMFGFQFAGKPVGWNPYADNSSAVCVGGDSNIYPAMVGLPKNSWHNVRVTYYATDATLSIWVDSTILHNRVLSNINPGQPPQFYIAGVNSNPGPANLIEQYLDDFTVSPAPVPVNFQPPLQAPWEGRKKITQGNNASFSHYDHGTWDNTWAIDIALETGSNVLAPADGIVEYVDDDPGGAGGKELAIEHIAPSGNTCITVYLHLSEICANAGDPVKQGQIVAKSGATGDGTGSHLHFHMWSKAGSRDSHTNPIISLRMKPDGGDFRTYDARFGELDDSEIADRWFESNNSIVWNAGPARQITTTSGTGTLTLISNQGNITSLSAISVQALPNMPPLLLFPHGLMYFEVSSIAPGSTVTLTLTFPVALPSNIQYWKYQQGHGFFQVPITSHNGNTITIQLPDGGLGDADGLANGVIIDPGGVAIVNSGISTGAPTSHGSSMASTITTQPVSLPNIQIQSASLSASKVTPGAPVTVTANVANRGTVNGSTRIKVYVNGKEDSSQSFTVESGGIRPVYFTVSRNEPGTYAVYAGGTLAGSFTVEDAVDPNVILFISLSLIALALILAVVMAAKRKSY